VKITYLKKACVSLLQNITLCSVLFSRCRDLKTCKCWVSYTLVNFSNKCMNIRYIYFGMSSRSSGAAGDGYSPKLTKAREIIFSAYNTYKYWEIFYALNYWPKFRSAFYRSRVGAVGWDTVLQTGKVASHWNFSLKKHFRPHYGPVVDSVS